MTLITCRATINLVGASAGSIVLVDPEDPKVALHIEKGYLVPDGEPIAESSGGTGGESDADETLETGAAVGNDAEALFEPVGDGGDEGPISST